MEEESGLRLSTLARPLGGQGWASFLSICGAFLFAIMSLSFLYIPVAVFTFLFLKSVCWRLDVSLQYPYRYMLCAL